MEEVADSKLGLGRDSTLLVGIICSGIDGRDAEEGIIEEELLVKEAEGALIGIVDTLAADVSVVWEEAAARDRDLKLGAAAVDMELGV